MPVASYHDNNNEAHDNALSRASSSFVLQIQASSSRTCRTTRWSRARVLYTCVRTCSHHCCRCTHCVHDFRKLSAACCACLLLSAKAVLPSSCVYLLQIVERAGRLPDFVVASVGGGGSAIGMFHPFMQDVDAGHVQLVGVEAGGRGTDPLASAATLTHGRPGVFHGTRTCLLQV